MMLHIPLCNLRSHNPQNKQSKSMMYIIGSRMNGKFVWERMLKVEYGRGGKKGHEHYLTDM